MASELVLMGLPQNKWTDEARVFIMNIGMDWRFEFAPEGVHPLNPDLRYRAIPTIWWNELDGTTIIVASGIGAIEKLANAGVFQSESTIRNYFGCERERYHEGRSHWSRF